MNARSGSRGRDAATETALIAQRPGFRRSSSVKIIGALIAVVAVGVCIPLSSAAAARTAPPSTVAIASHNLSASAELNLPAWPVLYRGNTAAWPESVRSLQYLLNAHGAGLAVDGVFGARTEAAVRAFQRDHALVVDGVVGEQTWSAVIITVRYGDTGPAVRAIQDQSAYRHITTDGAPAPVVDGVYGQITEEWVLRFQGIVEDSEPIGVDGIVGPLTWRALIGGMLAE